MNYFEQQKKDEADKKEDARQLAILKLAYQRVFGFREECASKQEGEMVFKDMMNKCMTFQQTMTGNSWTYYNEGKRSIGGHIMEACGIGMDVLINQTRRKLND